MNPILSQEEVAKLVDTLINPLINYPVSRLVFLQFVSRDITSLMTTGLPEKVQLMHDISMMNNVQRLPSGQVPLEIFLRNAAALLSGIEPQRQVIQELLDQVTHRTTGAPRLDLTHIPEIKEVIVHVDDMVTFAFMQAGVQAGASVMKLRVPRFDDGLPSQSNGKPIIHLGTGWLLTESLLVTNHHVINARNEGESNASQTDLIKQGEGTLIVMDYDADNMQEQPPVNTMALEAWHTDLDYALLRIPTFTNRKPLHRSGKAVKIGDPVNIIQHPGGRSKRYGIRNNLVSAIIGTDIRYFTDTDFGSSGSPVLNDNWEVVALHRGSDFVTGVQFQGKPTAYINLGTPLSAIMDDLHSRYPTLATEIGA